MTDKLQSAVDRYLINYTSILNNFPLEGQKYVSRYYDIDLGHQHILNKLAVICNEGSQQQFDDGNVRHLLMNLLELGDRKVEISDQLLCKVNDLKFELDMNLKDITEMSQENYCKPPKKLKRMLKWVHSSKEIEDILNEEFSKEHLQNKISNPISETVMSLNQNFQNNKTTMISPNLTRETVIKETKAHYLKVQSEMSTSATDSDAEIQPIYCICEYPSYGFMVCCDNDLCPIQWFHFDCVSLIKEPKGKWYCPKCRGAHSKIMKPRKVFLKELEEYNKRKEDDW